jgi:glycosyltransferase involved in cell wall biosynthesis
VSVVIPAHNAAATLGRQLAALAAQDLGEPLEVVVVDNNSTDATAEVARTFQDRLPLLRVIPCSTPGANAARNAGLHASTGELLLFCDADDKADPGWAGALVSRLRAGDALVTGFIDDRELNDPALVASTERFPDGPFRHVFKPFGITANLGVQRAAALQVGGFNEAYRYGCTDTEFCWRIQLAGGVLAYDRAAVMQYARRGDLRGAWRKSYLTGRAQAQLFRDFRAAGMPRRGPVLVAKHVGRVVLDAPKARRSLRARRNWQHQLALFLGRVSGSRRFRVVYL